MNALMRCLRAAAAAALLLFAACRGERPALSPPLTVPPERSRNVDATPLSPATAYAAASVRAKRHPKAAIAGVLNVNRATESELRLLPGIGKGRALAIVERRAQRPFASLAEVARIRGMKGVVRKLRSHLSVEGDSTLRPAPRADQMTQAATPNAGAPSG